MKVTIICGSPRKNGNTARILYEIIKALKEQSFDISQYFISELDIAYCCGYKHCETNGECIQNDDVKTIIDDIASSQLVVIASPDYWGDITGQLKVFIDRCTPFGNTNSSRKYKSNGTKGVAIAVRAGQNKKENDNLVHTIEHFLGHLDIPLISSFTVEGIDNINDLDNKLDILEKAYNFGKSIIALTK